jgi:DNA-damage-inducible protein D
MSDIVPAGQSAFDSICHVDELGSEYWIGRELARVLGYDRWENFLTCIQEAIEVYRNQTGNPKEVFRAVTKNPSKQGGRPKVDYHLSRHACYLIAQGTDGRKAEVAAAKTYFAIMTEQQEELMALAREVGDNPLAEVARRIALRQELTEAHKRLIERAEKAGVLTPKQRAIFMDYGYQGLYAGEKENDIHTRKELAPREAISSWMGAIETMAILLRAVVADKRMERKGTRTPTQANKEHYEAGKTVRGWLTSEGIFPEDLPTPTKSYKQIVKEEAARIAEEERLETLAEEDRRGLWCQLPPEDKE